MLESRIANLERQVQDANSKMEKMARIVTNVLQGQLAEPFTSGPENDLATRFKQLEDHVAALEHILMYQTVDPMVVNWDRHEILDTLNQLHEQMSIYVDFIDTFQKRVDQQQRFNGKLLTQQMKQKNELNETRQWFVNVINCFVRMLGLSSPPGTPR